MKVDNHAVSYLESRKLVKRWLGSVSNFIKILILLEFFYTT